MRLSTSLVFMLLVSPFSSAETLQNNLLKCAQNSDSLQRLVCYDKLAESLNAKERKEPKEVKPQIIEIPVNKPKDNAKRTVSETKPVTPVKVKVAEPASKVQEKAQEQEMSALDKFGNEDKQTPEALIDQIQAKVSKLSKSVFGQYTITLDNQQVWRQTDKTRLKLTSGQLVSIERGLMGSFFMGTEQVNKRIRVKRIK